MRIQVSTEVERHQPDLPRFVVIPAALVAVWQPEGTTVVEGEINGISIGRRSMKRWDAERWFIDLPEQLCRTAGIDSGDQVVLEIRMASTELPTELAELLAQSPTATERWNNLSPGHRRAIHEQIVAAKRPETRIRRARKALGLDQS
jgi:hypothetical protein